MKQLKIVVALWAMLSMTAVFAAHNADIFLTCSDTPAKFLTIRAVDKGINVKLVNPYHVRLTRSHMSTGAFDATVGIDRNHKCTVTVMSDHSKLHLISCHCDPGFEMEEDHANKHQLAIKFMKADDDIMR